MPPPVHMGRGYPPPPGPSSQQSQGYPQNYPPPVSHHGHPHQRAPPMMESGNSGRQPQQPGFNSQKPQILSKQVMITFVLILCIETKIGDKSILVAF